jgi:hypothetical protein
VDKDTVCAWLDRVARHCRVVMLSLWHNLHVIECQLDELWSFVHTKEAHLPGATLYCAKEHSVILTPFEVAVDGVQRPDRRDRYTWRSEVPTSHCRCPRTTMPQSACAAHDTCICSTIQSHHCPWDRPLDATSQSGSDPDGSGETPSHCPSL